MKKIIFVTVGTGKFERLIEIIDKNVGKINEKIIMQIGNGEYTPKNCEYFRFKPDLESYYKNAQIIISHAGAGTTFDLLDKRKKLISVANIRGRVDKHQRDIAMALSEKGYLIWHKNPEDILGDIEKARKFKFKEYSKPKCEIDKKINEFIFLNKAL